MKKKRMKEDIKKEKNRKLHCQRWDFLVLYTLCTVYKKGGDGVEIKGEEKKRKEKRKKRERLEGWGVQELAGGKTCLKL